MWNVPYISSSLSFSLLSLFSLHLFPLFLWSSMHRARRQGLELGRWGRFRAPQHDFGQSNVYWWRNPFYSRLVTPYSFGWWRNPFYSRLVTPYSFGFPTRSKNPGLEIAIFSLGSNTRSLVLVGGFFFFFSFSLYFSLFFCYFPKSSQIKSFTAM